jgi:hypothetical protein
VRHDPGAGRASIWYQQSEVIVFAPQHRFVDRQLAPFDGETTTSPFALDETAKYFLVLVALCEPRLRKFALLPAASPPACAVTSASASR